MTMHETHIQPQALRSSALEVSALEPRLRTKISPSLSLSLSLSRSIYSTFGKRALELATQAS